MAQVREHRGIDRRRGAQVQRLALVRQGDDRRAEADHALRRLVHRVVDHADVLVLHIAAERAVLHAAPRAAHFQQRHLRAVRHRRQDGGGRARLAAQVQAVQRVLQRHHGALRVRDRLAARIRRAVQRRQDRARHRIARAHQARIVKLQDLVVGHALPGHLLRAALAHAHAVAVAPGRQLEAARGPGDGERLVLEHVDGQAAQALHLIKVIQRHRHVAVARERQIHIDLLVHARGLAVLGRMHPHARDRRNPHRARADQRGRLRAQQLGERADAGGAVLVECHRLGDRRAVV